VVVVVLPPMMPPGPEFPVVVVVVVDCDWHTEMVTVLPLLTWVLPVGF
jgi:hypothetical protein